MTTQQDIMEVLKEHDRKIESVSLEKPKDCLDFWNDLMEVVYGTLPTTDGIDYRVRKALESFKGIDTLEVVNNDGKILKRFAKHYKSLYDEKLSDSVLGVIGDKLQYFLQKAGNTFYADFTNVIDWQDGRFGKSGSCWWGTYEKSQDVFISNGGWGIRFYENEQDTQGIGRTWILPRDGKLYCFNSYGVSRAMTSKVIKAIYKSHGIKLHYKAIGISNSCHDEIPYINGDSGFVLYPDDVLPDDVPDDYDVNMYVEDDSRERCSDCGDRTYTDDGRWINDDFYCDSCISDRFSYCDSCGEYCDNDDVYPVRDSRSRFSSLCRHCANSHDFSLCAGCQELTQDYIITDDTSESYCEGCQDSNVHYCASCQEWNSESHDHDDEESEERKEDSDAQHLEIDTRGLIESVEVVNVHWNGFQSKELKIYRLPNVNGLYLFHAMQIDRDENHFNITHEKSGLALKSGIKYFAQAKNLLIALSSLTDWNQDAQSITSDSVLIQAVREHIRNIVQ